MKTDPPGLTAPEVANLWTQYMNDSMALCVNAFLLKSSTDRAIQAIFKKSMEMSKSHLSHITSFFKQANHPVPKGFSEEDVNLDAPALFSENLAMVYLRVMTLHGMSSYALCVTTSDHKEQRDYFNSCLTNTGHLYNDILKVMSEKGILSHSPSIHPPDQVEMIQSSQYLAGWVGRKRPMNAIEISGLFFNMEKTVVKVFLEIGFSQVATSQELRRYFLRGSKICGKHLKEMGAKLEDAHMPTPKRWESEVSKSTVAPFSDQLMLFQILALVSVAVGYYGVALSSCQRRDLILMYTKLIGEIGLYAEDGIQLMIKNKWMEEPPTATDHAALARVNDGG